MSVRVHQPEEELDPEERDLFLQQLYKFMEDRGECASLPVSEGSFSRDLMNSTLELHSPLCVTSLTLVGPGTVGRGFLLLCAGTRFHVHAFCKHRHLTVTTSILDSDTVFIILLLYITR